MLNIILEEVNKNMEKICPTGKKIKEQKTITEEAKNKLRWENDGGR